MTDHDGVISLEAERPDVVATLTGSPPKLLTQVRSAKAGTDPEVVDGLPFEDTLRSHRGPPLADAEHPDHPAQLESEQMP
jgi:phosphoketolase